MYIRINTDNHTPELAYYVRCAEKRCTEVYRNGKTSGISQFYRVQQGVKALFLSDLNHLFFHS